MAPGREGGSMFWTQEKKKREERERGGEGYLAPTILNPKRLNYP